MESGVSENAVSGHIQVIIPGETACFGVSTRASHCSSGGQALYAFITSLHFDHDSSMIRESHRPSADCGLYTLVTLLHLSHGYKVADQAWTGHYAIAPQNNGWLLFYGTMVQWPVQACCRLYTFVTIALHLSLGSSMVSAYHHSSQGYGFHPRLGLKKSFFWGLNLTKICISQVLYFQW